MSKVYATFIPSLNEGFGSFLEYTLSCFFLCKKYNINFVYTNLKNIEHKEWCEYTCQEKWDEYINNMIKKYFLPKDILTSEQIPSNLTVFDFNNQNEQTFCINFKELDNHILYFNSYTLKKNFLYESIKNDSIVGFLSDVFFSNNDMVSYYNPNNINIGAHIRLFTKTDCCNADSRQLYKKGNETDIYFLRLMNQLSDLFYDKNIDFHIFSQIEDESVFSHYVSNRDNIKIHFHKGNELLSDIYHMCLSDVLLMSNSSLSSICNYYGKGICISRKYSYELKNSSLIIENDGILSEENKQHILDYVNKKKVQDFWNNRPCNINHSSATFLSREYFDQVEAKKYYVEPHIKTFAEFEKWKGKKVLEIGCGLGTDSINFARHGADITVVDLSERSLNICKERFKVFGLNAKFYHCDLENLSLTVPIEDYDLVYSFGVIHHTPNQKKAFSEISKYIGKNTEFRFMVYSKISFKLFWLMMEQKKTSLLNFDSLVRENSEAQFGCPYTYTYTFEEIEDILKDNNLHVKKIWKDHIFSYDIPSYKKGMYIKDNYWKDVDEKTFNSFQRELGWHTMVISKLNNTN